MFLYEPPEPPRLKRRSVGNTNSARTEEVFDELWKSAIPPNPEALKRIQASLKTIAEKPKQCRQLIAKELLSDPGLGFYYLKHLVGMLGLISIPADPLVSLDSFSNQQICDLFSVGTGQISSHKLSEGSAPQLLRTQHSFIAAKAAENLSRQLAIPEGRTFALAQIMQLTQNLFAWRYPSQFQRALLYKRRYRTPIEESLNSLIGINPKAIGNKAARLIGFPYQSLQELEKSGEKHTFDNPQITKNMTPELIVGLGDLLAKANDSEHYPEALNTWTNTELKLEEAGLISPRQDLEQEIHSFMQELGAEQTLPYKASFFVQAEEKPSTVDISTARNPFIKRLPLSLQQDFKEVYQHILNDFFNQQALKILINKVLPKIQLKSGCLYLLKADGETLSPSLNFGQIKKNRRVIKLFQDHPVAQSLFSSCPTALDQGSNEILLCSSLANSRKQAVLAMEFSSQDFESVREFAPGLSQAVACTFVDIIGQVSAGQKPAIGRRTAALKE